MQLGNNERVADDHEKTREEKEDDVDQAVVNLRREVSVLDEGSMPTILATQHMFQNFFQSLYAVEDRQ